MVKKDVKLKGEDLKVNGKSHEQTSSSLDDGEIQQQIPGKNNFLNERIKQNRMKIIHELSVLLM